MLTVSTVQTRSDWNAFQRFPWEVYRDLPQWVPPVLTLQQRELDIREGPFFNDGFGSTAEFYIARRGNEVVGRIAAIRNERHLARHKDDVGFFGFFESINDTSVARALLDRAERWLVGQGLAVSRGPTSFTLNDPAGVTIVGAEIRPSILTGYTPGYYADLLESCDYHKVRDLLSYHLSFEDLKQSLFKYEQTFSSVKNLGVEVRQVDAKNLKEESKLFARIFSESWNHNWGAFPMLPDDLIRAAKELGPLFDERLGYVATVHGEPAAVFLAIMDPSGIFQKLNGKLGLRGLWRIFAERKTLERCRVVLLGSLDKFRYVPFGPLMLRKIHQHRHAFPALNTIDFTWILEDNKITRDLAEAVGAHHCRTQRIYDKFIS